MIKKINPLISYVLRITQKCDFEKSYDEVYSKIEDFLKNIKDEDILFPLVCWIDEMILSGCWEGKNQWINNMLQVKYFNINNGGELFYEKLEDAKEKFYYVLMLKLGFRGKYFDNEKEIKKIIEKYLKKYKIEKLFPFAYNKKPSKYKKFISNIYNYKTVVILIIIVAVIYGLYYFNLELLLKSKGLL